MSEGEDREFAPCGVGEDKRLMSSYKLERFYKMKTERRFVGMKAIWTYPQCKEIVW